MADIVRVQRIHPDLWIIAPAGAPTVADSRPGLDTAVLEVAGGHLTWSLLSGQPVPAATLHDVDTAQEWLWALYGAEVALAVDEYTGPVDLPARPEQPGSAAAVRRLGYAHWAARWWPASTVDGIAALDPELLDSEIAELTRTCESVVDGSDSALLAEADESPDTLPGDHDTVALPDRTAARAGDYALAAGGSPAGRGTALPLGRGSSGWDWRLCPAGVVDASERAVSWELLRSAGSTIVRVTAVAAPSVAAGLPGYLRPRALVRTPAGAVETALELSGDSWSGEVAGTVDSVTGIEIYVPGVGPAPPMGTDEPPEPPEHLLATDPDARPEPPESAGRSQAVDPGAPPMRPEAAGRPPDYSAARPARARPRFAGSGMHAESIAGQPAPGELSEAEQRDNVREFARNRLRTAAGDAAAAGFPSADIAPLRAEIAAVEEDSDF
ncbi:hypothetical protein [Nocardia sp. CA-290969]|uniref:hypothetical protein n=1 Tax=Nocardia sp. CA-290969 TaxID=3239986 RepID=UPI003D8DAE70